MILNQNFVFSRPLTVTGAYFRPDRTIDGIFYEKEVIFHQMTLDRIENNTFILQNTDFDHSPVSVLFFKNNNFLKLKKTEKKKSESGLQIHTTRCLILATTKCCTKVSVKQEEISTTMDLSKCSSSMKISIICISICGIFFPMLFRCNLSEKMKTDHFRGISRTINFLYFCLRHFLTNM